ncbi:MAG: SPFH domain-containing protein, partial [Pseudomonadota bacterium]
MAQITRYPFIRHFRADASAHVQQFRNGRRIRSGRGLSFWFVPDGTSLSEIPMDDRTLPFLLKGQSSDFQDLTVQGSILWRVTDPEVLGSRVDFTLAPKTGGHVGQPIDQINDLIGSQARGFISAHVSRTDVRSILEAGVAPVLTALQDGFAASDTLAERGIEIVGIGVDDISPSSELARALLTPTFESLQQQADEATFNRRAMAVEKERAIAENELSTKIELETQRRQLIAREDENARSKAEAEAAALSIAAEAEAGRIRAVGQAKADMEREQVSLYADLSPAVLMALAAQEFAGKLQTIDNLTITPDMLSGLMA